MTILLAHNHLTAYLRTSGTVCIDIRDMPSADTDTDTDTGSNTGDIVTDPYLRSVLDASTHTRQHCTRLIDLIDDNAVAASQTLPLQVQLDLSKQQKLLYSHLAQLRGLNRNAIIKVRNTKQTTAEARQEIDRLHLQLQNLYYEERHLRGEISACESYEYVYLQSLEFVRMFRRISRNDANEP